MSNKKQTAVSELIKEMESLIDKPYINPKNALNDCIHLAYAKLDLEKQQIIDFYAWLLSGVMHEESARKEAEEYYKENYDID